MSRTKTQEELVREERDRLELLEKQRLMRMHDQHDHSAPGGDDLDEGYFEAVEECVTHYSICTTVQPLTLGS